MLIETTPKGQECRISPPPLDQLLLRPDGSRITIATARALKEKDPAKHKRWLMSLTDEEKAALLRNWWFMGRSEQLLPAGDDWAFWLYLAGRGAGKTRTGGELARELIKRGYKRLGFIAPTAADVRNVMVEGESGVLAVCHGEDVDYSGKKMGKPIYSPAVRRITWENGAQAELYSADEPERLRGPQHEFIWADELCAWRYPETWDLAMFGLRLGTHPRAFISTTPKPKKLILELLKDKNTVTTRGSTYDNRSNLADQFFKQVVTKFEGTRLGQQELEGIVLEEAEGALWNRELLDKTRKKQIPTSTDFYFVRIVVAVDPATTANKDSDETGIVVAGLGNDGHGYVLADYSGRYSPDQWAKKVQTAYKTWQADRVIAEKNQGGDMVRHTIHSVDNSLNVYLVHARRGKATRAEPISAFFEQDRAHIVGSIPSLEDELCVWEPLSGDESPNHLDAMVWAMTDLMLSDGITDTGTLEGFY